MPIIKRLLSESITHVEDLPIDEFVDTIRNMATMVAQEKLDGANLWVGMDEDGKLFTSREGKRSNAERRYAPEEWPQVSAFNQFRAAHAALQTKEQEIRRVLRPGDTVEAEVLFGRQPNSVTYGAGGKSYIAFLRGVNETPDEIAEHLSSSLANQQADAKFEMVDTADGKELSARNVNVPFQFIAPQRVDAAKLRQDAGVEPLLKKLESVLKQSSGVGSMTNLQLATTALTTVPKEQRGAFKQAKAELLARLQTEFKLPIKNALLSKVSTKSGLAADDITPDEDVGIEGIVLRDPSTGKQVKVVDKDIFTAINTFNQSMRGEVQSALNTTDPDAPLQSRGGLLGQLRIRIAELLGNRELAKASNVRKQLEPIKGGSPEEAIKNLAASMNLEDFQGVKKKILAMAAETYKELDEKLEFFKTNKDNYQLKLKNGKTIGLSDETVKKTLLTFAEARRNLAQLFDKLKVTKTLAALLAVLYGSAARAVHEAEPIAEMMLTEKQKHGEISLTDFDRKDTFQLVNSYLATVFMTMLIYHTSDTIGMRFLRDRKNWQLRKHNDDMSPFNHWGYVIWKSAKPDLEKHIMKAAKSELIRVTKKIPTPWFKYLHMDFSADKGVTVNWDDHRKTLTRLIELSGVRSDRVNTLLDLSVRFPELELAEQKKAIKKIAAFAHQFVPRSRLYPRLKVILGDLKDETDMVAEGRLLKSIAALTEEGEGAAPDGGSGFEVGQPAGGATAAGAIASLPARLGSGKHKTEMRRRNATKPFLALVRKHKDPRNYKDIK
jgi:hypothetical protein